MASVAEGASRCKRSDNCAIFLLYVYYQSAKVIKKFLFAKEIVLFLISPCAFVSFVEMLHVLHWTAILFENVDKLFGTDGD